MRLFGRKREEDDEEDENPRKKTFPKKEELSEKDKFFKDKKERKKRFEIKPWTRTERFFVVGVFLVTVLTSGVLALSSRDWKLPNLPRLSLELPSILPSETTIIEKGTTGNTKEDVVAKFNELTNPLSGVYGFFVIDMTTGSYYGANEKETFEAASLNKLPVMLAMYKGAEEGTVNLSTQYILKDSDKIQGSGSLSGKPAGTKLTFKDLVIAMGHESDNTAFGISKRILTEEKIIEVMKQINMPSSLITDDESTPYDIGFFFKTLLDAKLVSRETRDEILGNLTGTIYENWIAKDMPVPVAHKFGTLAHVRNDGGVVMATKPYVLVVMTKGIVESDADEVIPLFSKQVYNLLTHE